MSSMKREPTAEEREKIGSAIGVAKRGGKERVEQGSAHANSRGIQQGVKTRISSDAIQEKGARHDHLLGEPH